MELQLRIELAVDGFLLGERGDMAAADLLKLVLGRRRALETFTPQSFWKVDFMNTGAIRREVLPMIFSSIWTLP